MKIRGIDFVVVNVADVDASLRFYREVVGIDAPLTEETPNWVEFDTAPVALALRGDAGGAGVNAAIALAVPDVAEAVAELRAKGHPVIIEPTESDTCHSALLADPDGNLLIIHRRKDGTAG